MSTDKAGPQITCLSLSAPFELASQYADLLAQMHDDDPPAISIHETSDPLIWALNAYYQSAPDLALIKTILETKNVPLPALVLNSLAHKDWVSIVQSGLCPIKAGRFFIHGSHDRELAGQRSGDIEIDAGEAFGTAHHGTTKGCLLALDHLFRGTRAGRLKNVLDLGTGTGLLAIAAARILRHRVVASDIDPISVRIALQNAALNNVGPLVLGVLSDGFNHPSLRKAAPYDLIIANILAAPLLSLAPHIAKHMKPRGQIILSGLLRTQSRSIEARYHNQGFTLVKRLPLDEWMTLVLRYR